MLNYLKLIYLKYWTHPDAIRITLILIILCLSIIILGNILVPIFLSALIACLLDSIINKLSFTKFSRKIRIIIVFSLFIMLFVLSLVFMLPILWEQANLLGDNLPNMLEQSQKLFNLALKKYPNLISTEIIKVILVSIQSELTALSKFLVNLSFTSISNGIMFIVYLFLIPIMIYYFLLEKDKIVSFQECFFSHNSENIINIIHTINHKIGNYLKGKVLETAIVAIAFFILFTLFRLDFSFLLAFLVGISVFIPIVGAILVTIPVMLVASFQWGFSNHLFYLMGIYFILLALDANILVPLLFAEVLNMSPLIIIISILIFGGLFGFWGVLLAIPLATVIITIVEKWPQNEIRDELKKYII